MGLRFLYKKEMKNEPHQHVPIKTVGPLFGFFTNVWFPFLAFLFRWYQSRKFQKHLEAGRIPLDLFYFETGAVVHLKNLFFALFQTQKPLELHYKYVWKIFPEWRQKWFGRWRFRRALKKGKIPPLQLVDGKNIEKTNLLQYLARRVGVNMNRRKEGETTKIMGKPQAKIPHAPIEPAKKPKKNTTKPEDKEAGEKTPKHKILMILVIYGVIIAHVCCKAFLGKNFFHLVARFLRSVFKSFS